MQKNRLKNPKEIFFKILNELHQIIRKPQKKEKEKSHRAQKKEEKMVKGKERINNVQCRYDPGRHYGQKFYFKM